MLSRNVSLLHKAGRIAQQSVRTLMLQEHHGMVLLEKEGIKVPPHGVAKTPEEAEQHARNIGGKDYVITHRRQTPCFLEMFHFYIKQDGLHNNLLEH
jgi:acyl-CoA synthetase (NDP forming)